MGFSLGDVGTSGGSNIIMATQRKQFTGAKTKKEFREKDERLKRKKALESQGKTKREINETERRRESTKKPEPQTIHLGETPKPEEKETFLKPKTVGGALKLGATAGVVGAGAVLGGPAIAGAIGATITRASVIRISASTFAQVSRNLKTRNAIGKLIQQSGKTASTTAGRFVSNPKTTGLTKSMLGKIGFTIPTASILLGTIGTYPFAGFIKEEALQTLSFGVKVAKDSGDLQGQQEAIDQINELLNPTAWNKLIGSIPYANVVKSLSEFYEAATKKNELDQKSLDKQKGKLQEQGESDFARERRESDEASTQRKLQEQELDSQYFALIREKRYEEAEELLQSRLKGGN